MGTPTLLSVFLGMHEWVGSQKVSVGVVFVRLVFSSTVLEVRKIPGANSKYFISECVGAVVKELKSLYLFVYGDRQS